jgi:hypothetical protein
MRLKLAFVAVSLLFALMPPAASAGTKRAPCTFVQPTVTVYASEYARVFQKRAKDADNPDPVYACLYSRNRVFRLGTDDCFDSHGVGDVRLAGRYVGYSVEVCGISEGSDDVRVKDLRTGALVHHVDATDTVPVPDSYVVTDLELRRTGAVGWIVERFEDAGPNGFEVHTLGRDGVNRIVDSSTQIEKNSLALSQQWLFWRKDGSAFSTVLR